MTVHLSFSALAAAALCATLSLPGCSSAPTHFYTLLPPLAQESSRDKAPNFQFQMSPVRLPVQVDQPQIVIRRSDGSLTILESERWSAPLGDEFHDALVEQLELQLGIRNMADLPKRADLPLMTIRTDIRRFEMLLGRYALIDVVWTLSLRDHAIAPRLLTCSSVIREPAGIEVNDLVLAHQKAIAHLAIIIAKTAQQWGGSAEIRCPQ